MRTFAEYSFVIPHDVETMIEFMGGDARFEERLDYIFKPNTSGGDLGVNGLGITTIMNIGYVPPSPFSHSFTPISSLPC